jgi:hypothetical protein
VIARAYLLDDKEVVPACLRCDDVVHKLDSLDVGVASQAKDSPERALAAWDPFALIGRHRQVVLAAVHPNHRTGPSS